MPVVCAVGWAATEFVSVTMMRTSTACAPQYRVSKDRTCATTSPIDDVDASRRASLSVPDCWAYQCRETKSAAEHAVERTVEFHSCGPAPNGQVPGATRATPALIEGSAAFIARLKARTPCA